MRQTVKRLEEELADARRLKEELVCTSDEEDEEEGESSAGESSADESAAGESSEEELEEEEELLWQVYASMNVADARGGRVRRSTPGVHRPGRIRATRKDVVVRGRVRGVLDCVCATVEKVAMGR